MKTWQDCAAFHGHECGGLTIGYKASLYAIELLDLDFSADEQVVCIAENDACGIDAIQVMLARALAQQPKVLLLDEPTSALDIQNQYQVLKMVRDLCHKDGLIAAVVIHDLNLALRFCDRFLLLKDGAVYRYGDRSILDSEALKEVYGIDAQVIEVNGRHMVLVEE